jgi:hypothetical protein
MKSTTVFLALFVALASTSVAAQQQVNVGCYTESL